jgi:hypothetical protein
LRVPAVLIWRSTSIDLRFELKAPEYEIQGSVSGLDHGIGHLACMSPKKMTLILDSRVVAFEDGVY